MLDLHAEDKLHRHFYSFKRIGFTVYTGYQGRQKENAGGVGERERGDDRPGLPETIMWETWKREPGNKKSDTCDPMKRCEPLCKMCCLFLCLFFVFSFAPLDRCMCVCVCVCDGEKQAKWVSACECPVIQCIRHLHSVASSARNTPAHTWALFSGNLYVSRRLDGSWVFSNGHNQFNYTCVRVIVLLCLVPNTIGQEYFSLQLSSKVQKHANAFTWKTRKSPRSRCMCVCMLQWQHLVRSHEIEADKSGSTLTQCIEKSRIICYSDSRDWCMQLLACFLVHLEHEYFLCPFLHERRPFFVHLKRCIESYQQAFAVPLPVSLEWVDSIKLM